MLNSFSLFTHFTSELGFCLIPMMANLVSSKPVHLTVGASLDILSPDAHSLENSCFLFLSHVWSNAPPHPPPQLRCSLCSVSDSHVPSPHVFLLSVTAHVRSSSIIEISLHCKLKTTFCSLQKVQFIVTVENKTSKTVGTKETPKLLEHVIYLVPH